MARKHALTAVLAVVAAASAAGQDLPKSGPSRPPSLPWTAAATTQVTGTLQIAATVTVLPQNLPDGTMVYASASAGVFDATVSGTSSALAQAKIAGGKARVTLTIPYAWPVASRADKITINLVLNSSAGKGSGVYQGSANFSDTVSLPANGATLPITFSGTL